MKNEIEKLLTKEGEFIESKVQFSAAEVKENKAQVLKVLQNVPLTVWKMMGYSDAEEVKIKKNLFDSDIVVELKLASGSKVGIFNLDKIEYFNRELATYSREYYDYCKGTVNRLSKALKNIEENNRFIPYDAATGEYYKALLEETIPYGQYGEYYTQLRLSNALLPYCEEKGVTSASEVCKLAKKLTLTVVFVIMEKYTECRDLLMELLQIDGNTIEAIHQDLARYSADVMKFKTDEQKIEILDWILKGNRSIENLYTEAMNNICSAREVCSQKEKYLFELTGLSRFMKEKTLIGDMEDYGIIQSVYLRGFSTGYIAGWLNAIFTFFDTMLSKNTEVDQNTESVLFQSSVCLKMTENQKNFICSFYKVYKKYLEKDFSEYNVSVSEQTEEECKLRLSPLKLSASGKNKEEALENLRNKFEEEKECLIIQWINSDYFPEKDLLEFIKADTQEEIIMDET